MHPFKYYIYIILQKNKKNNTFAKKYFTLKKVYYSLKKIGGNVDFWLTRKNDKGVQLIKSLSLPAGILDNIDLVVHDRDIEANDILVMCTDGIIESNSEYQNKELWVKNILEELITDNVQKIADIILKESIDNGFGKAKDDMTIIVIKIKMWYSI